MTTNFPVELVDLHPPQADFHQEVLLGLQQPQKAIPPKFLYDQSGSQLFDEICTLEEYYLTRSEIRILQANALEIADLIGGSILIEFGSGSCQKIKILLEVLPLLKAYIALDISKDHLRESCLKLAEIYSWIRIIGVCADYSQPLELPSELSLQSSHKVGFFPGSSVGNFDPTEAIGFLKNAAKVLQPHGGFLIGVDLKKDPTIIEPAYDDEKGVSAEFALNVLRRINRELKADFQTEEFRYRATYEADTGRVAMGLVSLRDQSVHIDGLKICFEKGELLLTENSYKYSISEFQNLAKQAGYQPKSVWTDPDEWYSLHYLHLG